MSEEKSGLQMIEEILNKVNVLEQKIDLLDQVVKKIANSAKVAELIEKTINTPLEHFARTQVSNINEIKEKLGKKEQKPTAVAASPKGTMVFGKLVANVGEKTILLGGVIVKVYDDKNNVIKETKSNACGEYRFMIKVPGNYIAEISGKYKENQLVPKNIPFVIKEGTEQLELK